MKVLSTKLLDNGGNDTGGAGAAGGCAGFCFGGGTGAGAGAGVGLKLEGTKTLAVARISPNGFGSSAKLADCVLSFGGASIFVGAIVGCGGASDCFGAGAELVEGGLKPGGTMAGAGAI